MKNYSSSNLFDCSYCSMDGDGSRKWTISLEGGLKICFDHLLEMAQFLTGPSKRISVNDFYPPQLSQMRVNVGNEIEWRDIVGFENPFEMFGLGRLYESMQRPKPKLLENERVEWVVGSDIPIIVKVGF